MALRITTFSNVTGGDCLFKALGHPLAVAPTRALIERLRGVGPVAIYDPHAALETLAALYDLSGLDIAGLYVQRIEDLERTPLGRPVLPVTMIGDSGAAAVFVTSFDAAREIGHIADLVPPGADVVSLDEARLGRDLLTNARRYLDPLNFATNFAFFRDGDGRHTRLVSANYWSGYGGRDIVLWLCLFDGDGNRLADWRHPLADGFAGFVIDSAEVRARHGLGAFTGQLFVHVINAAGHDVVKYALDTYGDDPAELSCTHDANAWPADNYAGLPAPENGERVTLWVQNSHPVAIRPGGIGLNMMGDDKVRWLDRAIAPFASYPLDVRELLPDAAWPAQIEVRAGKHMVRPRYEVESANGRSRIAHVNVERGDLEPDPHLAELGNLIGKGYILPAPVLPPARFRTVLLPTPMSTCQTELPIALAVLDATGREVLRRRLGRLPRNHDRVVAIDSLLAEAGADLPSGYGHLELIYDFSDGAAADGWLHGLFRYSHRTSGHAAETSFGAHMFNLPITYRNEPQSYAARPPGLSTRLFLRLGPPPHDTLCHLIYPASAPWREHSATRLILFDGAGRELAARGIEIPCSGSRLWRVRDMFGPDALAAAGAGGYVLVRDQTCRLFGYHGLVNGETSFSFDHMFGF